MPNQIQTIFNGSADVYSISIAKQTTIPFTPDNVFKQILFNRMCFHFVKLIQDFQLKSCEKETFSSIGIVAGKISRKYRCKRKPFS